MPQSVNDYIKELERNTSKAKACFEQKSAEAGKVANAYQQAIALETLLKDYWERIQTTDRLAIDLIGTLDKAIAITGYDPNDPDKATAGLEARAQDNIKAFEVLTNNVREAAECLEALKTDANFLKECFAAAGIADGDQCKDALTAFAAGIENALKSMLAAVLEFLKVLKASFAIQENLTLDNGIEQVLVDLFNTLKTTNQKKHYGSLIPGVCTPPTAPSFPLVDNKSVNPYYTSTEDDYKGVKKKIEGDNTVPGLAKDLATAIKARNEAKSCWDSLEAALKAAKEANTCPK